MEDFVEIGMLEEDTAAMDTVQEKQGVTGGEILSNRTYDRTITHDKFYQRPELPISGPDV